MTDPVPEEQVEAAYRRAARLIERGRRATAHGRQPVLRPVQPAIVALCRLICDMPTDRAHGWIERLNVLLRELHALGAEVAALEAMDAERAAAGAQPNGGNRDGDTDTDDAAIGDEGAR